MRRELRYLSLKDVKRGRSNAIISASLYWINIPLVQIEEDNDPRTFAEPEPEDDDGDEHEPREHLNLEDLFRLFQAISNPPPHMREGAGQQSQRQTQHQQQQQQQQQHQPGEFPTGGHPILLNPFQVGSRTGSGTGSRPAQNTDEDEDVDMENAAQDNRPEDPMIPGPAMSLAESVERAVDDTHLLEIGSILSWY